MKWKCWSPTRGERLATFTSIKEIRANVHREPDRWNILIDAPTLFMFMILSNNNLVIYYQT